jgi:cell division transport system ATP-binding protein
MSELIRFDNVSRFYSEKQALVHVSCSIHKGELLYLTGPSGAGKSTFLKLLSLQDQPCEGIVFLNGYNIAQLSEKGREIYRRKIGFVQQTPRFIKDFTIAENVALPLRLRGFSYYQAQKQVKMALYKVGLLSRSEAFFYQLSGGEKQRAEIARSIVYSPVLLLADEPTGNLDYVLAQEILDIFYELNDRGTTVIIATHDKELLSKAKERIFALKKGLLEEMSSALYCEKVVCE